MAYQPKIRGVRTDEMKTQLPNMTRERDVRPISEKIVSGLHKKPVAVFFMSVLTALTFSLPSIAIYFLIIGVGFTWWALTRPETSPVKIPVQEKTIDKNEINPGTNKPSIGKGIFFIGNDVVTHKEVWVTNDDCRQHFLVMGTTGAGKTELLLSFSSNALSWGSGFLYVDGKADRSLYAKILVMCRRWGREDDMLVLNFMTGDNSVVDEGGNGTINTNTMNPFANGSPDALVQLVVSLMGGGGGDNQMWVDRAQAMFTGMMYALVWLRDAKGIALGVGDIRDHLQLGKLTELIDKNIYPDMPERIVKSLKAYLSSLSGWSEKKKPEENIKNPDVTKQHGFLEMQFTKIFSSLVDVYSNIFNTSHGEIDVYDVVLNRRILVVMLPALEKAPPELASLGKIIVASMKGMMGSVLGSHLEGDWDTLVENRPTSSPSPFIVIFDEVGYYAVAGMAVMAAQGRSLGFSLVYASQDLNSLKRNEEKESESIIGNTNLKMLMRTEDKATQELGISAGGKETKVTIDGYNAEEGKWDATQSAKANMDDVINATDLKGQDAGYLHFIYKDKVVRARSFYADAPSSLDVGRLKIRPNHFITVERHDENEVGGMKRNPMLLNILSSESLPKDMAELADYEEKLLKKNELKTPSKFIGLQAIKVIRNRRGRNETYKNVMKNTFAFLKALTKPIRDQDNDIFRSVLLGQGAKVHEDNNILNGSPDIDNIINEEEMNDNGEPTSSVHIDDDSFNLNEDTELHEDEVRQTARSINDPGKYGHGDEGTISEVTKIDVDGDEIRRNRHKLEETSEEFDHLRQKGENITGTLDDLVQSGDDDINEHINITSPNEYSDEEDEDVVDDDTDNHSHQDEIYAYQTDDGTGQYNPEDFNNFGKDDENKTNDDSEDDDDDSDDENDDSDDDEDDSENGHVDDSETTRKNTSVSDNDSVHFGQTNDGLDEVRPEDDIDFEDVVEDEETSDGDTKDNNGDTVFEGEIVPEDEPTTIDDTSQEVRGFDDLDVPSDNEERTYTDISEDNKEDNKGEGGIEQETSLEPDDMSDDVYTGEAALGDDILSDNVQKEDVPEEKPAKKSTKATKEKSSKSKAKKKDDAGGDDDDLFGL